MEILIAAIGKMKASPELEMLNHYLKQSRFKITLKELEEKKVTSPLERKLKESEMLLEVVPKGFVIVALDERGKEISSLEFADKISEWYPKGIAFLIGGAGGHHDILRQRSDFMLAFGRMTWPHMLARVMLAEQIYRARTIIDGHPYHKE